MKSEADGKTISRPRIDRITRSGIRLELDGKGYFMRYTHFPWFQDADPEAILHVERMGSDHLRWPRLDIDLSLDSIRHPDRYPLIFHRG